MIRQYQFHSMFEFTSTCTPTIINNEGFKHGYELHLAVWKWVIGMSRDHHCNQPAPRQCNAPMAGNPLGTHHTELTVEKGRGEGGRKMSTNRAGGGQMQGWFLLARLSWMIPSCS